MMGLLRPTISPMKGLICKKKKITHSPVLIPFFFLCRQILEFANGGVASLDWAIPLTPLPEDTPTLVILHGLTGGSHENYIRGLLQIASTFPRRKKKKKEN
jgi:hypothetical protein